MATQAERKAKTRRALIEAAKQLFETDGFDAVSVDQIVKKANVAKGTFYQYYQTKVDILADAARDEGAEKIHQALQAVADGACALEMLERFVKEQCQWFEAHEKVAEAILMAGLKTVGEELKEEHRHARVFMAKLMVYAQQQGSVRPELDPRELSKLIGGALIVSVLAWLKQPTPGALYTSMKQSLDIILNGAKVRK